MLRCTIIAFAISTTAAAGSPTPAPEPRVGILSPWYPLQEQLDGWIMTTNFSLVVGNASHPRLFAYNHNASMFNEDTNVITASTSKWCVSVACLTLPLTALLQVRTHSSLIHAPRNTQHTHTPQANCNDGDWPREGRHDRFVG
jgi:hypothetical protein